MVVIVNITIRETTTKYVSIMSNITSIFETCIKSLANTKKVSSYVIVYRIHFWP